MKRRITVRHTVNKERLKWWIDRTFGWMEAIVQKETVMAEYKVVEIFESINGEGMRAGELAVFVRMRGCNLHCSYCDTAWACEGNASYTAMTEDEICQRILETGIKNVTLTGGEPLMQENIGLLLQRLAEEYTLRVEIETNGSVDVLPYRQMSRPPVFTLDYKLPGSGMEARMCRNNLESVTIQDSVKFVVSDDRDLTRAKEIIETYRLSDRCHVILSAVFDRIEPSHIVSFMRAYCLNDVRLQLQMHKYIWDPERRGV